MTVFDVSATQFVNSTGSQFKQTIIVYHQSHRQYLQARTSKARVGAKVTICDELDIMDDKLYMELHVFEYESLTSVEAITNTPPVTVSPSKRSRLSQLTKEVVNTPPASNSTNQETNENTTLHPPNHNTNENQLSEHGTNTKQSTNTIAELSSQPYYINYILTNDRNRSSTNQKLESSAFNHLYSIIISCLTNLSLQQSKTNYFCQTLFYFFLNKLIKN